MTPATDAIFWLSLTLLGLVGVVSTIAYAFAGRIRELVEAEQQLAVEEFQAQLASTKDRLKKELDLSSRVLTDTAKVLQSKEKQLNKHLKRLRAVTGVLDAKRAVFLPSGLLLLAFLLASLAKTIALGDARFLTPIAVASLLTALFLVGRDLTRIRYLAELLTPHLLIEPEAPTSWSSGKPHKVTITVLLRRGTSLHNLQTVLYVPPSFTSSAAFLRKLKRPTDDPLMPSYNVIPSNDWPILKRDIPFSYDYDRLTPTAPGNYTLYYRVVSAEYSSPYAPLMVVVA